MRARSAASPAWVATSMRRASMTVFPVTEMVSSGTASRSRAARAASVGAKWSATSGVASLRFTSSGKGDQMLPVRSPASTWPMGMRR